MWWRNAVIYQIYPRSFQDSDGDGIGDLAGIAARLEHVRRLGADAVWLSPFYPSPNADYGYDVSDYTAVDPEYGTLAGFDELVARARRLGLRVVVDFVPCHTSTAHPWFRERPDFYFWAEEPLNNWRAAFGGSAWERDPVTGRFYLHSFFPEQADLNWRRPAVREAMAQALRFWIARGVDGFRLDALNHLMKDPELRDDPVAEQPFGLPLHAEAATLSRVHSTNAPDIGSALEAIRAAVGESLLIGEVYMPTADLGPYLETLDLAFAFEVMHAGPDAERLAPAIAAAVATGKVGWVLSNHDFDRLASRFGPAARAAAMLFAFLPGPLFVYQGDELGMRNGPGANPPRDRNGRDPFRHPMQWDGSPAGGFTTGTPWLPATDPAQRNVAAQERDPRSTLNLFKELIALRRELAGEPTVTRPAPGVVLIERGEHALAANFGQARAALASAGELVLEANPGDGGDPGALPPHAARITRR